MQKILVLVFLVVAASAFSQSVAALEAEGDTLLDHQDYTGALAKYNLVVSGQAKKKESGSPQILYKRAICNFYLQDFQKALADVNIFIQQNPTFTQGKLLRAFIYRELGDSEKQLIDISDLLSTDPWNVDLLKWRAGLMVQEGKHDKAQADLLKIKEIHTDEVVELYLGLTFYYQEKPDSAIIHFNQAISINGGYVPAYTYAGSLCLDQGAYRMALTYIDLALRLEPQNLELLYYKGVALVQLDRLDEGCRCLNKAFYGGVDDAEGYLSHYCYQVED